MLLAIDHGNSAIKTPEMIIPTGLIMHTQYPPATDGVLYRNGYYCTLSEERIPYMRDKTADERFYILTLFAIAKTLSKRGILSGAFTIDIAAGLPPQHYQPLREAFEQYLKGDGAAAFTFNGRPFRIEIEEVYLYPQCFAGVVAYLDNIDASIPGYIIDIGGYTVDLLLLRDGKPDLTVCSSLDMGAIMLYNQIISGVNARYGLRLIERHITAVLTGQRTLVPDAVRNDILTAAEEYADKLLQTLREHQIDLRANYSYFLGGGAMLLKPWIEKSALVASPQFITETRANAIGYQLLAERQKARCERKVISV